MFEIVQPHEVDKSEYLKPSGNRGAGKRTGRQWGDKKPIKIIRKWKKNGVRFVEYEYDSWDGGTWDAIDGRTDVICQEYIRFRATHSSAMPSLKASYAEEVEKHLK